MKPPRRYVDVRESRAQLHDSILVAIHIMVEHHILVVRALHDFLEGQIRGTRRREILIAMVLPERWYHRSVKSPDRYWS
jgi:hypothetical protein